MKLFIGGVPRSGTTALCKMLNSDDNVLISTEFNIMFENKSVPEIIKHINTLKEKEDFRRNTLNKFDNLIYIGDSIDSLFKNFKIVGDKSPSYCFSCNVKRILNRYNDAKIIFCIRGYMDFIWSSIRNYRRGYRQGWTKSNILESSLVWNNYIEELLYSIKLLNHDNLFICRYEEYSVNSKKLILDLSDFLSYNLSCEESYYNDIYVNSWVGNITKDDVPKKTRNLGKLLGYL